MTIYYVDPEGGDDTKSGTSFANRWRSLKPTQTTPLVQDDELRFMASKPSYILGTATFVDNTEFFTLSSWDTKLKTIDRAAAGTGWVKAGASMVLTDFDSMRTATAMTGIQYPTPETYTGKILHKTLSSPLDLSAFTHITALLNNFGSHSTYATLHLCSDTAGDVPLVSFTIPRFRGEVPVLLGQEGVPLPSGVRSVAVSVTANPKDNGLYGYFGIENIMACLAPSNPNHISHSCLFAVEDDSGYKEWLPIRALIDGQVYIGGKKPNLGTDHPKWRGTPGVKEVHILQPVTPRWLLRYESVLKGSSLVKLTGGWSRTDMATQDGVSWYSGEYARMFNGGEASSDPDNAESAADDYQRFWAIHGTSGGQAFPKTSNFGFAHYVNFPLHIRNFLYYYLDFDLAGLVGVVKGLTQLDEGSVHKSRQVSFCCDGLYDSPPATNPSLLAPLGGLDYLDMHIGVMSYTYREAVLPSSTMLTGRSVLVDRFHGLAAGIRTDRGPGLFRLRNSVFQFGGGSYDLVVNNTCWLEGCSFLAPNGEATEPRLALGSTGLALHSDRTNGEAWDTRTYTRFPGYPGNHVSRVMDTIFRVPGMRSLEIMGGTYSGGPMRAQAALIPVRANTPVKISGYLKQQYPAPEFGGAHNTWLTVLPGYLPGVELQRQRNLRSNFGWCRMVLEVTSEVDGLLPIFVESDFGKAWVTEIKLDESGLPPSPPFDPDPNTWTITDTLTFTAEPEDVMGFYDSWSGGTATARDAFASVLGVTLSSFTASTLSNKVGKIGGVSVLNAKDGVSGFMIAVLLEPGWNETYPIESTFLRLRDDLGGIVVDLPYQSPGVALGSPYDGWQYFGSSNNTPLTLVSHAEYTLEVIRPPLE